MGEELVVVKEVVLAKVPEVVLEEVLEDNIEEVLGVALRKSCR